MKPALFTAFLSLFAALLVAQARSDEYDRSPEVVPNDAFPGLGRPLRELVELPEAEANGNDEEPERRPRLTWKRSCEIGGGLSHHCTAARMSHKAKLADWLRSAKSPGKRTSARRTSAERTSAERTFGKRTSGVAADSLTSGSGASNSGSGGHGERKSWDSRCSIGAGNSGYECHLAAVRNPMLLRARHWMETNDMSPGKRAIYSDASVLRRLLFLRRLLQDRRLRKQNRKRNCSWNLGAHCATESAASLARFSNFLSSADSPGRRRKRSISATSGADRHTRPADERFD